MPSAELKMPRPLVSCIMPTADRRAFVGRAVEYFLRQEYAETELIVVDDGADAVDDLVPAGGDGRVRYFRLDKKLTVGAKRNYACERARGEIVAHWDDDDWHAPRRLSYQVAELTGAGADACGIQSLLFYDARRIGGGGGAWQYLYPARQKFWLSGSSLCYRRAFWERNRFQEINVGEDARFVWNARGARLHALTDSTFHVGIIHGRNVSPKRTGGAYWKRYPAEKVRELLGTDAEFYDALRERDETEAATRNSKAATPAATRAPSATRAPAAPNAARPARVVGARRAASTVASARRDDATPAAKRTATAAPEVEAVAPGVEAAVSGVEGGKDAPAALVAAAYGVGDILRVTPLVRALSRLGYAVDVLVAPDYAETAALLEGAPEIRRLIRYDNFRASRGARPVAGLDARGYELAAFTLWGAPLKRWVRARRVFEFGQREWLRDGDSASIEKIARAAGWEGEMPAPFAVASDRRFDLPPGTVALHPGCKPDWPWKKWHGFDELARMFPSVVVVGTPSDLENGATYFRRAFEWPAHARSFVGELNLQDTAALLSECAALVSNDSGLMHLGVAVDTPTFGVFGITSPAREAVRSPQLIAVTKGLPCEAACRAGKWGRRDCDRHLECLKTLTAAEVFARVRERVPEVGRLELSRLELTGEANAPASSGVEAAGVASSDVERPQVAASGVASSVVASLGVASSSSALNGPRGESGQGAVVTAETRIKAGAQIKEGARSVGGDGMEELSVAYYGYVFDASGYGHAARAYIHALHAAGVRLAVVPLANRTPQVRDELVESLAGRDASAADFHLFHGIPPQWAARAFPLRNAIGMTVWETDAMPSQWRNALNHVLEVWLPCEHNVSVFRPALERPVFKLPHPLLPRHFNGDAVRDPEAFLRVAPGDFVFYSLFEWQQRKSPHELIETYLREFSDDAGPVLVVKANPGAAAAAAQTLEQARARTKSGARVELRCEAWSDAEIDALHARGDCYVSLHRGEGWGYPLFEAAARGTPVVATNYSGPLEYLNEHDHALVRYRLAQVRQPYVYYSPRMRWAEPDCAHAAALMRQMYERRDEAKSRAHVAAERLRGEFSLEAVGEAARAQLTDLLRRTQPAKWQRIERAAHASRFAPAVPIPADWYDADYFERGLKSNWERGYTWELFSDLFTRTAAFLTETFTEAESFLDAGCAKGFLVRALRERGKDCVGFDHSEWAVERADESVRPHLVCAGADEVEFGRGFDMLVACSLFESLTEEQIHSFLSRARAWTRHAVFATIPSFADAADEAARARDDRDFSHITMRTRAWWREAFLAAGWRQDALHRTVERACQSHELPRRMNWDVYVYAPR